MLQISKNKAFFPIFFDYFFITFYQAWDKANLLSAEK
ncbi:hypothetical protein Q787_03890 [Ornithobacterium rhinotracheale H06-030791]|nr:hypothetical protein Q785_04015 [Ornithobacterium rhinotracheale ORT-UMN 88]KGB67303.1 hypothetical protein Q787_03890 [Ornithobacterium rhinotracheale H06-030791]